MKKQLGGNTLWKFLTAQRLQNLGLVALPSLVVVAASFIAFWASFDITAVWASFDSTAAFSAGLVSIIMLSFALLSKLKPRFLMCSKQDLDKDLSGKFILITGANSGIGLKACKHFYKRGAKLIMTGRSRERLEAARDEIVKSAKVKHDNPKILITDFADLDQLKTAAAQFLKWNIHLDILLNNAGIMAVPKKQTTAQGLELQIGTNHFGPWLFTELIRSRVKNGGRIVITASNYSDGGTAKTPTGKVFADVFFDDINFQVRSYEAYTAYAQSKLANVLHGIELSKRCEARNISVVSLHPGFVATNLLNHNLPVQVPKFILNFYFAYKLGQVDIWTGVQTTLHCCLSDDVRNHSGGFFAQSNSPNGSVSSPQMLAGGWPLSPHPASFRGACSPEMAHRLWLLSESTCRKWLVNAPGTTY